MYRNLKPQDEHLNKILVHSKLQYKIDQESYHMYYIVGSEDVFIRPIVHTSSPSQTNSLEKLIEGWSTEEKEQLEAEARKLFE
jgi:paired amphipathic helix protein Sin3a